MALATPETIRTLQRKLYRKAKQEDNSACLAMKDIGKPCTGKPYARFDEGEQTTTATARLMRHRQTKAAETDRPAYRSGRLFPTLPINKALKYNK